MSADTNAGRISIDATPVPWWQTFLCHHIQRELAGGVDDILAVKSLIQRIPTEERVKVDELVRIRLLLDFFHHSSKKLYVPISLHPDSQSEAAVYELRNSAKTDPLRSLTDCIAALWKAEDHRGIVLCAGSGSGKTVACRRAFLDCLLLDTLMTVYPSLPDPPPLAGMLPVWLPVRSQTKPQVYSGAEGTDPRLGLLYELLIEASQLVPTRPNHQWTARCRHHLLDWLGSTPLLLFVDLNTVEEKRRLDLAGAIHAYQDYHGRHHRHRIVLTYRSTQRDDAVMNRLRENEHFLFFDLEPLDDGSARGYLRRYREFEKAAYCDKGHLLPAPSNYVPGTEAEWELECKLVDALADRYVQPDGESLICRPLLMHLVAEVGGARLSSVQTLADLYEEVVSAHIERDLKGPVRSPRLKSGSDGPRLVRTAMTRVALAMQASGEDVFRLGSVHEFRKLLTEPERGAPDGEGAQRWWPEDLVWTGSKESPVSYYREQFHDGVKPNIEKSGPEVEELLEFSLLRRSNYGIGFLHDSFLDFFLGVHALRHYKGPVLVLSKEQPLRLTSDWLGRIVARLISEPKKNGEQGNPLRWRRAVEFLSGVLTPDELVQLLDELLLATPAAGVPQLVSSLLRGRCRPCGNPLMALYDTVFEDNRVIALPEALFSTILGHVSVANESANSDKNSLSIWLGKMENRQSRPWLRLVGGSLKKHEYSGEWGHNEAVHTLEFLEDGRLCSGGEDSVVRVWNLNEELGWSNPVRLAGHRGAVRDLVRVVGGLASAGDDGTIRIWDPNTGNQLEFYRGEHGSVRALAAHNKKVFFAGTDGHLREWDREKKKIRFVHTSHTGAINALAVLNSKWVASAGDDGTVWLSPMERESAQSERIYSGCDKINALAVVNKQLAWATERGRLHVWNIEKMQAVELTKNCTSKKIRTLANLNGKLVSAGDDNDVRVWDLENQLLLTRFCYNLTRLPDGRISQASWVHAVTGMNGLLVTGYDDGNVRVWKPENKDDWQEVSFQEVTTLSGISHRIRDMKLLGTEQVVSASDDGTVRSWCIIERGIPQVLNTHKGRVRVLDILPNKEIISGGADCSVHFSESDNSPLINPDLQTSNWILAFAVGADWFAIGDGDGVISVWDIKSKCKRHTLISDQRGETTVDKRIRILAVMGDKLVSGGDDKIVRVWDIVSGTQIAALQAHIAGVRALAVFLSGKIAAGDQKGTVIIWDPSTENTQILNGHTGFVNSLVVFHPPHATETGCLLASW